MPDLLALYNEQNKQDQQDTVATSGENPNPIIQDPPQEQSQQQPQQRLSGETNFGSNPEERQRSIDTQMSNMNMGTNATENTRDRYDDPTTWSPEYTDRSFLEEAGTSIMRGVGNSLIKGTGDMLQVLGGFYDKDLVEGTALSKALQESGEEFAAKFQSFIPEDLQHENLSWKSAMDPRFWSTHVAELIPNVVEFIFLSKGGSALARKGATSLLKGASGATKTALGETLVGTGKGLTGALTTDIGLTRLGSGVAGAVGGGITGNLFAGLQNAAEVINTNKDLVDENGNKVFSDEDLQQMAAGTVKHNAKWVLLDMASWGYTFGGGAKMLKGINPVAKGGKMWDTAQQMKIAGNLFNYQAAPMVKAIGRLAGKAIPEGFEEMYQESFEEWAKKKAMADVTGEPMPYNDDFFEFFNSKENKATKVISAAMGALAGGAFNIKSLINSKADDSYRLYDRTKNLTEIINQQGTDKELEWQQFHIRKSLADLTIDDKYSNDNDATYNDMMEGFIERGNITEDQKKAYDEMYQNFKTVKTKGQRLNVKGLQALLYNNAIETHATAKIAEYENIAKENIADVEADELISEKDKAKKIQDIENAFLSQVKATSLLLAESKQNQANLIIGKKASKLDLDIVTDEFGNDMVVGGLSSQQFNEYTKDGKPGLVEKMNLKKSDLKEAGLSYYNKIVSQAEGLIKKGKGIIDDKLKKQPTDENQTETENETDISNDENNVSNTEAIDQEISEEEYADFIDNGNVSEERLNSIADKVRRQEDLSEQEKAIFTDKTNEVNSILEADAKRPVPNNEYEEFKKSGAVSDIILDKIADDVNNERKLTDRQDEIRKVYKDDILERIVKKTLGTDAKTQRAPHIVDNLSKKELDAINKEFNVNIKRTDAGIDIETKEGSQADKSIKEKIDKAIQSKVEEKLSIKEDGELSAEENEYLKNEAENKTPGKNLEEVQKSKNEQAKENFKIDPKNVKDAPDKLGLDKRVFGKQSIRDFNIKSVVFNRDFLNRLNIFKKNPTEDVVSQNDIDNYLNQYTSYNLNGPSNLDKMMVINHHLKRMFPNTNNPTSVIVVRNLFESIGSLGLGTTLANTIYIDEKSWEQENVFMHEMAHVYYQLAQDQPEVQKLIKASLSNPELVDAIKKKYPDYIMYKINQPGGSIERSKQSIFQTYRDYGADENMLEEYFQQAISEGDIETIPLSKQKYIIEEMFTAQLEGPLAAKFDKIFNTKNEVQRQADVKKFWGLIRKKGDIINNEDGVDKMLRQLFNEDVPNGDPKQFILNTFKAVTKGVTFDSFGLDARADEKSQEYWEGVNAIASRKASQINNDIETVFGEKTDYSEDLEEYDTDLEEDGTAFYQKDFDTHIKATSRILRRFGVVYNKTLRAKQLIETRDKVINRSRAQLFDTNLFESFMYNLAIENNSSNEFIYNIENSAIKEVQAFNRYLDKVYPGSKLTLLNSMHYVLSNGKHIVGLRNTINDQGDHNMINSLSNKELQKVDDTIARMKYSFDEKAGSSKWNNYVAAVNNIYKNPKMEKEDFFTVLEMLSPSDFNLDKILEQGFVTFRGMNVPLETLISGIIKKGYLFNYDQKTAKLKYNPDQSIQVYYAGARPVIEALVNTNRKFTPLSSVMNAEKNMEPVRIINNHLTKEIDNIISFLAPDEKGKKKTKEEFIAHFSHVNHLPESERKRNYKHNQFLENIYDQYQNGILPTISQYHGVEDESNNKGSLYKNSTALEQGIEDFMTYLQTAVKADLKGMNATYLGNMGAFSDSPRKFFMNMKRIAYGDVVDSKGNLLTNGAILSSVFRIHEAQHGDLTRTQFAKEFKKSLQETVDFVNQNAKQLQDKKIVFSRSNSYMKEKSLPLNKIFKNNKLTEAGERLVKEYAINNIVNGYNVADVFAPGIKGDNVVKRFKMNSSPIMSVKNPNFKIEPIFFADEIVNNSIAGTDSGMYILKEDAQLFQNLGKGVFEMNNGFKFLNASVEKDNPNFKSKTAYLKGYTTIVDESHPLYKLMKARKDKYLKYHKEKFGTDPSQDLSDGTPNHIVIAVPQSSDKSNFSPNKFTSSDENGNMVYTEVGQKFTEQALSENIEDAMKYYDNLHYTKKGDFLGISAYNFGPQQVMDKTSKQANLPVQMVNSIIVNATLNGKLDEAYEIQQLLSDQKRANLQKILDQIKSENIEEYTRLIKKGLNTEDMDQGQRILLWDNGSLAHPYINEIVVNQLAKTIRREGNKLKTQGTYAQQKPDSSWRSAAKGNKSLKGYTTNGDGSLSPAEIVLPKHMEGSVNARTLLTTESDFGKQAIRQGQSNWGAKEKAANEYTQTLNLLQFAALNLAEKRHNVSRKEAEKFITEVFNEQDVQIGYHVKGDLVIASRVPGSKPGDTGVFEVLGFDKGDGNQVMVSSDFNRIIGSDNDGDALFVQTKSSQKGYGDWNKAFDKITKYWLSPEMARQILSPMEFEKQTDEVVKEINAQFPQNNEYVMPNSPKQRMIDYNNTMVSKRNVGPVFNIHKITNMLAAVDVPITKQIEINKNKYNKFADDRFGNESRNQQSAILANIILDNAKSGYADAIGLNEYNISQAVLLVNLGVPLVDVGKILNSPAAKLWADMNRNNNSMYHETFKKETIIKNIYKELKIKEYKGDSIKLSLSDIHVKGQNQAAVVELLSYLSDMNSEIQKISTIMGGHNKIHVNPLVLEKQLQELNDVLNGKHENPTLELNEKFKSNPDLQNYIYVAEETLRHTKNINPIYHDATNGVLTKITSKIGGDLSATQIEKISQDILKFNTSRLLALNNKPREYVENLLDKSDKNPESIYNKLNRHFESLRKPLNTSEDVKKGYSLLDNSVLFKQAMNMNLTGNVKYISANPAFVNSSFNEIQRERAQEEFEQLPVELKNDLLLYDMIHRGWKGPQSLAPFFGKDENFAINLFSNDTMKNKNKPISPKVLEQLEKAIVLRSMKESNNPFDKVYIEDRTIKSEEAIVDEIFKNKKVFNKIIKGQPLYVNVIKTLVSGKKERLLYELQPFTENEVKQVITERSWEQKKQRTESIARSKMKLVPDTLSKTNSNIDLTTIEDKNNGSPFTVPEGPQRSKSLDYLVEASITYEEAMKALRAEKKTDVKTLDAREDFYEVTFTKEAPLSQEQFNKAMEFKQYVSEAIKTNLYQTYVNEKNKANKLVKEGVLDGLETKSEEQLLDMYKMYGERDVYAFAGIITPVIKQLAKRLAKSQSDLLKKNNVEAKGTIGEDVSVFKSYLMTGSTIPSNHPASQGLVRMLEKEYKNFINEKKVYMQEMERLTNNLYKEVGYGGKVDFTWAGIKNFAKRLKDATIGNREEIYQRLYGNLVIREESLNKQGTLVFNYKLKTVEEVEALHRQGIIGNAQKEFYDYFRKTTKELMPPDLKEVKEDYIPHTSMSKFEMLSSRGLLGLMANSRHDDQAIYDVKMIVNGELMNFKTIEDNFKIQSARGSKNDFKKVLEYRKLRSKASKLLKTGKNEDGSEIMFSEPFIETALGFGAINRFANNRSVKSTELPSMDLNKALGDYIHSTLFVNGNKNFKGMEKLGTYIDGVLAWNEENNLTHMNDHIKKVWKDYFLRSKRQVSIAGEKVDRVVLGLTRLNLFYALGYKANVNTGGLYAIGNILAGKYHNIKELGGKAWLKGEARFWGLDKGFQGGIQGVLGRMKRNAGIMKELNFMEINVYDEVAMEKKYGLDAIFTDMALAPMIYSEKWIQQVHMLGMLTDEQYDKFDAQGKYKPDVVKIDNEDLIRFEDEVKSSHGRGYQPTDQRALQMYSWGNMMLQFSRFIPTMVNDRFGKEDVNIYGKETIGSMRAVGKMLRYVLNDPKSFVAYRNSLSEEQRKRLDSGLKGVAMSAIIGLAATSSDTASDLNGDVNYYWNYPKLTEKMIPSAIQSTNNLVGSVF